MDKANFGPQPIGLLPISLNTCSKTNKTSIPEQTLLNFSVKAFLEVSKHFLLPTMLVTWCLFQSLTCVFHLNWIKKSQAGSFFKTFFLENFLHCAKAKISWSILASNMESWDNRILEYSRHTQYMWRTPGVLMSGQGCTCEIFKLNLKKNLAWF